jgi:hypothetical protein
MLDEFSNHLKSFQGTRDINYGFAAIEHRHKVLEGEPYILPDERKIDLSRLLIDIYGVCYIGHPRLEKFDKKEFHQTA